MMPYWGRGAGNKQPLGGWKGVRGGKGVGAWVTFRWTCWDGGKAWRKVSYRKAREDTTGGPMLDTSCRAGSFCRGLHCVGGTDNAELSPVRDRHPRDAIRRARNAG
jgi:hypothetical protein